MQRKEVVSSRNLEEASVAGGSSARGNGYETNLDMKQEQITQNSEGTEESEFSFTSKEAHGRIQARKGK